MTCVTSSAPEIFVEDIRSCPLILVRGVLILLSMRDHSVIITALTTVLLCSGRLDLWLGIARTHIIQKSRLGCHTHAG